MAKIVKTALTAAGKLPKLQGRDVNDINYYINECCRSRFDKPQLSEIISSELYMAITEGLPKICRTDDFIAIDHYSLSKTDKRYVYELNVYREGSSLTKVKKVIKDLLQTTSVLNNLRGEKVRRSTNTYRYTLDIDCNDSDYPSAGIHRLARLLCAFNERKYLSTLNK